MRVIGVAFALLFYAGVAWPANSAESALLECRSKAEAAARLACYDAIRIGEPAVAAPSQAPEPDPVPAPGVSTTAEALFGKDQSTVTELVREVFGAEALDALEARISELKASPYQKWIVRLDNGQLWMQTDSKRLALKSGDDVVIHAGMSGSYRLEKASGSRSIRVKRVN